MDVGRGFVPDVHGHNSDLSTVFLVYSRGVDDETDAHSLDIFWSRTHKAGDKEVGYNFLHRSLSWQRHLFHSKREDR